MITEVPRSASGWAVPSLRTIRRSRLWTQRDLAAHAKVSLATVVRLENGEVAHAATIRKLAHALGVTSDELLVEPEP